MIRSNVHLTPHQFAALRQLAQSTGLTLAEIIRRAVDEYLAKHGDAQ